MYRYRWYGGILRVSVVGDFLLILPILEEILQVACHSLQVFFFFHILLTENRFPKLLKKKYWKSVII